MIETTTRDAWRELEAKLRPFVARRLRAEADVDDVLQDVFLRMQRGIAGLRDDRSFGAWVYRIARNAIADHGRARAKHRTRVLEDEPAEPAEDDRAVERELASHVARFVEALPSPYREALTLTGLQGLTQQEAAARLGISVSGMKSRVQRGRAKLREAIEACCAIALDARGRVVACDRRPASPEGCCA